MAYRFGLIGLVAFIVLPSVMAQERSVPASGSGLDRVEFDTAGWHLEKSTPASKLWSRGDGDVLGLDVLRGNADLLIGTDVPSARRILRGLAAGNKGSVVYADLVQRAGMQMGALIYKREQLPAYAYTGILIVRGSPDHFQFTVASIERGTTGVRDALVTARLMEQGRLDPTKTDSTGRIKGWFFDPYDSTFDSKTINSLADAEEYDSLVPSHPLTKVRRTLRSLQATLSVKK